MRDKVAASGQNPAMTSRDDEPFLTEPEAAEVIRVSARTLRRWRAKGTGPPVAGYAGRRALYRRSELLAWLTRERGQ
jgi:predicted DNA-binding transcriptional regulator AlpA